MSRHGNTNAASTDERRAHMRQLGAAGGRRRAELARLRRAEVIATVVLDTTESLRAFLTRRAAEVEASGEAPSVKASAAARIVGAIASLDGMRSLMRERDELRARLAAAESGGSTHRELSYDEARAHIEALIAKGANDGDE